MRNGKRNHDATHGRAQIIMTLDGYHSPRYGVSMPIDGMTLKLERVRARVKVGAIAKELGWSRQLVTKLEANQRVQPLTAQEVRDYRIALLKCADIDDEVA